MKAKNLVVFFCVVSAFAVFSLTGCINAVATPNVGGEDDNTGGGGFTDTIPTLYLDKTITYGFWDQITSGLEADYAIGDYNTTVSMEATADGAMKVTVGSAAATAGWSAGTLAQVSDLAKAKGSYFDFTNVKKITFKVRGTIPAASIKFKLIDQGDVTLINEVAVTSYGVSSVNTTDWSQATVDVSALTSKKISTAFCFVLGVSPGYTEFKDIGFLDASNANVDITQYIAY